MGIPDHLTCLLRNLYAGQEATIRTEHRTTDWFKIGKTLGKEYVKAVYCHLAYLTYVQSTSCELPAGVKLESRLLGELSTTSDMHLLGIGGAEEPVATDSRQGVKGRRVRVELWGAQQLTW